MLQPKSLLKPLSHHPSSSRDHLFVFVFEVKCCDWIKTFCLLIIFSDNLKSIRKKVTLIQTKQSLKYYYSLDESRVIEKSAYTSSNTQTEIAFHIYKYIYMIHHEFPPAKYPWKHSGANKTFRHETYLYSTSVDVAASHKRMLLIQHTASLSTYTVPNQPTHTYINI